jgi:hypothetical protein
MANNPKAPAKSKKLDKNTVEKTKPKKSAPQAPTKAAPAAMPRANKGGAKGGKDPMGAQRALKPKTNSAAKKAPAKRVQKTSLPPIQKEDKRSAGRPSKYRPEYAEKMIQYFMSLANPIQERSLNTPGGGEKLELRPVSFPNFARFAVMIGVSRDTIHHWATEKDKNGHPVNPAFSDAYARARAIQEAVLLEGSMAGVFESRIAGLAAKNLIGWADKLEQTVDDVTGFSPEERAELERSYNEAKLSGVWVKQRADMKARKQALSND